LTKIQKFSKIPTAAKAPKTPSKSGFPLDKLEQLTRTPSKANTAGHIPVLQKRARAKYIGDTIKRKLSALHSPFQATYYKSCLCASTLHQSGDKITSRYCGARWCIVCSRIRTAKAINGYHDQLKAFPKLYFLTLTIVSMRSHELRKMVKEMNAEWRQIINKSIKVSGLKNVPFNGVRKLEVTYSLKRNDYHPHYHIICDNLECAEYVLARWMIRFPNNNIKAQNIREVTQIDEDNTLKELFKYSTKFHSTYIDETGKKCTGISAYHLDQIFRAIKGLRTYQPFGKVKKVAEDIKGIEAEVIEGIKKRKTEWGWIDHDWWNIDDGDCLSFYEPSARDIELKENIVLVKAINKKTLKKVEN
jgi:hypothetical protein